MNHLPVASIFMGDLLVFRGVLFINIHDDDDDDDDDDGLEK